MALWIVPPKQVQSLPAYGYKWHKRSFPATHALSCFEAGVNWAKWTPQCVSITVAPLWVAVKSKTDSSCPFKANPNKIPEPWLGHQLWEAPSTISTAHRKNPEASHRHFPFICQVNKHLQSLLCAGHQARCWALRGECCTQENVIKLHSRLKSYRETSSSKHPRICWMFET